MKKILIMCCILYSFLISSAYGYTINDLLKELDIPNWREKITDPHFLNQFKVPEKFSVVVSLADARGYDWRYRIRAIRMLGHLKTPQAEDALLNMFQDHFFHHECPSLKSYVAEALGDFSPGRRLMEILKEGLKDPEVLVREATARSLERLKMPESAKYLIEAFNTERSLAVRIAIIKALKAIGTHDAISFIKAVVSDGNHRELIDALGGSI